MLLCGGSERFHRLGESGRMSHMHPTPNIRSLTAVNEDLSSNLSGQHLPQFFETAEEMPADGLSRLDFYGQ